MHLVEVLHRNSSVNVTSNVMSRVVALYHIVINTKHRRPTINEANKRTLYSYIYSIIKKRGCFLYRMNGIANHIHILLDLHPSVSLSNLMLEIKRDSSIWMKQSGFFPEFDGWGKEYAAFTCAYKDRNGIIEYIKSQEVHHGTVGYEAELEMLCVEAGRQWDEYALS